MSNKELVAVAKIVGAHGIKGELRVYPYVEKGGVDDYLDFFRSHLEDVEIDGSPHTLKSIKPHKNILLVKFSEITTRERAIELQGVELFCERSEFPKLPDGEYYEYDLVGLEVYTSKGQELGKLTAVLHAGSDVYEIHGPLGEVLLPAISEVIVEIDLSAGRMIVEPLEGLLPDEPGSGDKPEQTLEPEKALKPK